MRLTRKKKPQPRKLRKKDAFLAAFRACCNLTAAAKAVGCDRALHYAWLRDDPAYAAAFAASMEEAAGTLKDSAVEWATRGVFEPNIWKGQFQYSKRKRVMCRLNDGTSAFEDELPKGAVVVDRRSVVTQDGEMLGTYRRSEGLLSKLLSAHLPEFRPAPPAAASGENADAPAFTVTIQTREPGA